MDDGRSFTVAFPEARKARAASTMATVFFLIFWILWGIDLFGAQGVPDFPWLIFAMISFLLFAATSIYSGRLDRELTLLINRRVAEEFALHAQEDYPRDVDILKVRRSLAVKRADGTVSLWGVQGKRDVFMLYPIS